MVERAADGVKLGGGDPLVHVVEVDPDEIGPSRRSLHVPVRDGLHVVGAVDVEHSRGDDVVALVLATCPQL